MGILGLTFKENVPDLRNSKVPDIVNELRDFGVSCLIHDTFADAASAQHEYGLTLSPLEDFQNLDALVLAVNHSAYLEHIPKLTGMLKPGGVLIDVKSALRPTDIPDGLHYWSL